MLPGIRTLRLRQKRIRTKGTTAERKKKAASSKSKTTAKTPSKKTSTASRSKSTASRQTASATKKCVLRKGYKKLCASSTRSIAESKLATASVQKKCAVRKGYKTRCKPVADEPQLTIADAHKARVQKAQSTAMSKLMDQIGKPYRWGGTSPRTGFDCSGLVYYAYKDLVKIHIPRTANEMYHLRDARPVDRGELQSGDLVFFRTRGRGTADHVGVYVGNGKFIQSPRTGTRHSDHLIKRRLLGTPLRGRTSRHDAENHSLIVPCRCGDRVTLSFATSFNLLLLLPCVIHGYYAGKL